MPRKQRFKPSRKPKPAPEEMQSIPQAETTAATAHESSTDQETSSFELTDVESGK